MPQLPNPRMSSSEQHIEDLLDNYSKLRGGDLPTSSTSSDGPDLQSATPLSKRLVLPPLRYDRMPPCRGPSCLSSDVMEDVTEGCVVCLACGLIQSMCVLENASIDAIYHEGVSRYVVHRYSRIARLRGCLRSLQGETKCVLAPEEKESLLLYFQKEGNPAPTGFQVKKALSRLKFSPRLQYHAHTIAYWLFRSRTLNPSEREIREVLRLFRALENAWDRLPLAGSIRKGKKKFLSVPVVWHELCSQLGFHELGEAFPLPKSKKVIQKTLLAFSDLVDYINK